LSNFSISWLNSLQEVKLMRKTLNRYKMKKSIWQPNPKKRRYVADIIISKNTKISGITWPHIEQEGQPKSNWIRVISFQRGNRIHQLRFFFKF